MPQISVLVSQDNTTGTAFEFRTVETSVEGLTKVIECQYMSAVPGQGWAVYFNEDQSVRKINHAAGRLITSLSGHPLAGAPRGRCVFVGTKGSEEIDVPEHLVNLALSQVPEYPDAVCLFRHRKHIFVYDDHGKAIADLLDVIEKHRQAHDLDTIEVYFGVPKTTWVEIRVEVMDDWATELHDRRNDRSYG